MIIFLVMLTSYKSIQTRRSSVYILTHLETVPPNNLISLIITITQFLLLMAYCRLFPQMCWCLNSIKCYLHSWAYGFSRDKKRAQGTSRLLRVAGHLLGGPLGIMGNLQGSATRDQRDGEGEEGVTLPPVLISWEASSLLWLWLNRDPSQWLCPSRELSHWPHLARDLNKQFCLIWIHSL